jgi:predicted alpha/beta-fold hydrolase
MLITRPAIAPVAARLERLVGPRAEALLNFAVVPALLPVAAVSSARRLLRARAPLRVEPRYSTEAGAPPLVDVKRFAARAECDEWPARFGWGSLDFQLQYAPAFFAGLVDLWPRRAGKLFACPPPFREARFESLDGTPLFAQVATRPGPRPGLVVVHGSFGAGGQPLYADAAIEAFAWGFNVVALDLRGWGKSAQLPQTVITCGWNEAEDVLAAARFLKESSETTTVGALGYSLGGSAVLNAAAHELAPALLAGGVMSESGLLDPRATIEYLVRNPGVLSPAWLIHWLFRLGFGIKFRACGLAGTAIASYSERIAAPSFGLGLDELWARASILARVDRIRVPALHLHAEDDWVVPVEQAIRLRGAAAGNPLVGVCIRPRGAHCAFALVMGSWRSDLARRFFASAAGVRSVEQFVRVSDDAAR